jgi:hypothetical protein
MHRFDWSEDWFRIGKKATKVQVAHVKLCHSRAFFLRAHLTQTHEMLFDAHNHAFRVLGGIPERGILDNMKTAAGWEKGKVEKNVRDARHRLLQDAPEFADLGELNAWLEARCQALWQEAANPEQSNRTVAEVYADERSALMAMPPPFDGFIEYTKRVSPTCLVIFEHNRYSVPATLANRVVSLRAYADKIVLVAEAEVVAEHVRAFNRGHKGPGQTVYDWRHYLAVVQRRSRPSACR